MEYHLDYETYSACDLKKLGQYRYASDPTTEILLCAVCCGDGPVLIWDRYASDGENAAALSLIQDISLDPDAVIWAHNAPFEIAISKYLWSKTFLCLPPKPDQWRCTAALCRVAAIPSSLAGAAEFLELGDQKDPVGKALIKVFSVPHKTRAKGVHATTKRIPSADPKAKATVAGEKMQMQDAWNKFRDYCVKDVVVERAVGAKLAPLNLTGVPLEAFLSDLRMNDNGIPVDIDALGKANILIEAYEREIGARFTETTGLSHTQRDKVFEWIKARGYPADDLRANTVGAILDMDLEPEDDEAEVVMASADPDVEEEAPEYDTSKMTPECYAALRDRALLSFAAIKKIKTMMAAACPDDRIRGAIIWYGAMRTGRKSSKTAQVHNMKRPTINTEEYAKINGEPETHSVFRMIKDGTGSMDLFESVFGPPFESIASSIRHFIGRNDGGKILDIDLAQIEARVLAWLAGHTELLKAFHEGKDLYKVTVGLLWGVPYKEVTKEQRFLGKVAALACGYQGGVNAFLLMAKVYGAVIDKDKAKEVVKAYRDGNKPIKDLWSGMQKAAVEAITTPGVWVPVNNKIKFAVTSQMGYPVLVMKLPSGRNLYYPKPEVRLVYKIRNAEEKWVSIPEWRAKDQTTGEVHDGVWVTNEITYYGQIKQSTRWGRIKTHGGVFTENACQAVTDDFLTLGTINAEKSGYDPMFSVHDQCLFWHRPEKGNTVEGLVKVFTGVPAWAPGFPLGAEAAITDFYTK